MTRPSAAIFLSLFILLFAPLETKDFIDPDIKLITGLAFFKGHKARSLCSATIVNPWTVLTAAHCLISLDAKGTLTYNGPKLLLSNEFNGHRAIRYFTEIAVFIHPKYISVLRTGVENHATDLAIFKLKKPFPTKTVTTMSVSYSMPKLGRPTFNYWLASYQSKDSMKREIITDQLKWDPKDVLYYVPTSFLFRDGGAVIEVENDESTQEKRVNQIGVISKSDKSVVLMASTSLNKQFIEGVRKLVMYGSDYCGYWDNYRELKDLGERVKFPLQNGFYIWLMGIFDRRETYKCHGVYIGQNKVLTLAECVERRGKIAGLWEMNDYLENNRSVNLVTFREQEGVKENNITFLSPTSHLEKEIYIRPICSRKLTQARLTTLIGKSAFSAGWTKARKSAVIQTEFTITSIYNEAGVTYVCAKLNNRAFQGYMSLGYPLFIKDSEQHFLIGLGTIKSTKCAYPFRVVL